ncbi:hypothetical protein [Nostoc sp. NMS8]|uniref:hypothetical protein n=1 Tax=Nostoc sp. NMS8 TaxID=2815392 RepID=UPI0025F32B9D|nr:hypothetical protein [Nostoc sp. NMS8]MBN3959812.1 hypothetical protein [Nostoc sp. NMS8]
MAQYAIAFDLKTSLMKADGMTQSQITYVYQTEIPSALANCGFTAHPQGSLYHTELEKDPINALMQLQSILKNEAPKFCKYVNSVDVFRMEEWSDVTPLIANRPSADTPSPQDEVEEQEIFESIMQ